MERTPGSDSGENVNNVLEDIVEKHVEKFRIDLWRNSLRASGAISHGTPAGIPDEILKKKNSCRNS